MKWDEIYSPKTGLAGSEDIWKWYFSNLSENDKKRIESRTARRKMKAISKRKQQTNQPKLKRAKQHSHSCDCCVFQEGRHFCRNFDVPVKNMDIVRCDHWLSNL